MEEEDLLNSSDNQSDQGTSTLLGASEPAHNISGGFNVDKVVSSLSDLGANAGRVYSAWNNPSQSGAKTPAAALSTPPPPVAPPTAKSNTTTYLIYGAIGLVVLGGGFLLMRRK
jgi:hypothetical protein